MHTTNLVRRRISQLPLGRLFTTRDFLVFGTRASVDKELSRLVKKGIILRLARGVFVRQHSHLADISAADVARVKAESFGKQLATWGGNAARELGLITDGSDQLLFCVNGSSSSFKFGGITIYLRKTCARKLRLNDSRAGKALRALWHIGKDRINATWIENATRTCRRTDREEIRLALSCPPAWLSRHFLHWRLPPAAFNYDRSARSVPDQSAA